MKHIQLKTIQLKNHQELNERWLQDIIADDPSIIGIGDVILKDKESELFKQYGQPLFLDPVLL